MKKWMIVIIAAVVLLAAYRIIVSRRAASKQSADVAAPVEITKARRANIWETVDLTGDVRGYFEARVFPKVPGKFKERLKEAGERVSRDETFATIDRDEPAFEYALAEVKSPLDGIITRYFSSPGETVSPASPVAEVSSTERIKVVVQVSEKDIIKIVSGQSAKFYLDSYPSRTFTGRVENISRSLDSVTRTSAVEISAENPDGIIRPGMFAKVEILVRNRPWTLVVPRSAVMFNPGGDNAVFIVDDGLSRRKVVRTGISGVNVIEILSGISEGDKIITLGQYSLSDGDKVNVCAEGVCPER